MKNLWSYRQGERKVPSNKFFIAACSAIFISALCGCNSDDEVVPEIAPVKKVEAPVKESESKGQGDSMPELQSIQSLSSDSETSSGTFSIAGTEIVPPGSEGSITIQVSIQPSKRNAQAVLKKLEEKGIRGYLAQVENPGELEGTYYRVRVGYFKKTDDARAFGKASLEPLGFAWWIDNKANDQIGSPESGENAGSYGSSDSYNHSGSYTSSSPEIEEAPVQEQEPVTPSEEPAPVQESAEVPAEPEQEPAKPVEEPLPAEENSPTDAIKTETPATENTQPAAEAPAAEEVYDDWESF